MLYLFCSAAAPLYKRDALESISYPAGHIFRYRYARKYVQPEILADLTCYKRKDALLVFLDTTGSPGTMDFSFYPLRTVRILQIEAAADAIYLTFLFGQFVHYGNDDERQRAWDLYFKQFASRPWPPNAKSGRSFVGYFVLSETGNLPDLTTENPGPYENWDSVVNALDRTRDLAKSTFCLVLGFYQVTRSWFGRTSESRLDSTNQGFDSIYPIPMGKSVVLKVLLSRPSFDYDDPDSVRVLRISTAGDAFSGMSKDRVLSESRYNEDRTVLLCKRVFDTALATVSIEEPDAKELRSPRLTLLTSIRVPRLVIGTVVAGVALSALLLALDADVVTFAASLLPGFLKAYVEAHLKATTSLFKLLAPVPAAVATYVAFKRLPIK